MIQPEATRVLVKKIIRLPLTSEYSQLVFKLSQHVNSWANKGSKSMSNFLKDDTSKITVPSHGCKETTIKIKQSNRFMATQSNRRSTISQR